MAVSFARLFVITPTTDAETIAAGLLHDTVEDGVTTNQEIEREFGQTIAFLVEGVTKLGKLRYQGAERHAEHDRASRSDGHVSSLSASNR